MYFTRIILKAKDDCGHKLLFADIHSLVYEIETDDLYKDFYREKDLFTLAIILKFTIILSNKKSDWQMKDEAKTVSNDELVGLKSRMYFLVAENNKKIKGTKGVNKSVIGSIRHKEYAVLFSKKQVRHNMKRIQSNCIK